ncbi:MAG: DNA mismatch repair endonuclease MutL [Candidatus Heimdallarchaeota archaeon]|nr:DNA mismatch repair endonuclease MutL [Candidatus Heimdallarchaeota archaeon]
MSEIIKLSTKIISQISAGEVVERPSNIVKELIENSLDAGSRKILIQIKNGGLDQVLVRDEGNGLNGKEIVKAFELHTTSKLLDEQISKVATLGFRGEALASIAAVSRVECKSKRKDENVVYEVVIEGGEVLSNKSSSDNNDNSWTSIKVTGLFFNTPVRRKFLKKAITERKRIMDLITHFALTYPHIHFILEEDYQNKYKTRLESPSRKSLLAVIFDVLGSDIASELIKISSQINEWQIDGYISKPNLIRSDRSIQFLCVNGRIVRHQELQKSIEIAYGSQLMRSAHPILILNIAGPIDAVDFNIHPQKSEIRFKSSDTIITDISNIIRNALDSGVELPKLPETRKPDTEPIETEIFEDLFVRNQNENTEETKQDLHLTVDEGKTDLGSETKNAYRQLSLTDNTAVISKSGIEILGHIMDKFALAYVNNELWLIDVHAADERVKFEYYEQGSQRKAFSQELLQAISISLIPSEKQFIVDNIAALRKFGLKVSDGRGPNVLIHSTPVYFDQEITADTIKKLLLDISGFLGEDIDHDSKIDSPLNTIEYGIVARLACHGSIRSGHRVINDVIAKVIDNLLKCTNPWTCAHGRPTILRMPRSRLEGWFRR